MGKVIQLGKKAIQKAIGRNRLTLSVSHMDGKVTGTGDTRHVDEFGDRLARIKASLERIDQLMINLKAAKQKRNQRRQ